MQPFAVNFYLPTQQAQFTFRRMSAVPARGDTCVFNEQRYTVASVEWCLDEDATTIGTRINIELIPFQPASRNG